MDITSATTAALPAATTTSTSAATTALTSDFETFLQMLTAQAKYQDPLEPLDSSEYASQLAQFSSVEQQVQTNDLLNAMSAQLGSSNLAQYAGWIGMEARSTAAVHFDGQPISVVSERASVADQAYLVVTDASGNEVDRELLPVSADSVQWAGVQDDGSPFEDGVYSFAIESRANGQVVETSPAETYNRIVEARVENGQTILLFPGDVSLPATSVSALREATGT